MKRGATQSQTSDTSFSQRVADLAPLIWLDLGSQGKRKRHSNVVRWGWPRNPRRPLSLSTRLHLHWRTSGNSRRQRHFPRTPYDRQGVAHESSRQTLHLRSHTRGPACTAYCAYLDLQRVRLLEIVVLNMVNNLRGRSPRGCAPLRSVVMRNFA